MVARGCAWLPGVGGGGHAWLPGGMHGCWGVCVVAIGGAYMIAGGLGHVWLPGGIHDCQGACMVATGCVHGCGGACVAAGACMGYDEIRSMSGRYASYWNAFLCLMKLLDEWLFPSTEKIPCHT